MPNVFLTYKDFTIDMISIALHGQGPPRSTSVSPKSMRPSRHRFADIPDLTRVMRCDDMLIPRILSPGFSGMQAGPC